jgi:hypothetical protein
MCPFQIFITADGVFINLYTTATTVVVAGLV